MLKPAAPYDTIEDELFIAALSEVEYRDAAAIEREMIAAGTPATLTTIRERMAEFVANTDCIKTNGDGWRIVLPITPSAGDLVLHQGCGLELMRTIPSNSIPLVLADMPYGITRLAIDPKVNVSQWLEEMNRIVTPTGAIVSFGTQPFTTDQINANRANFKQMLVWAKSTATGSQLSRGRHMTSHEDILVFSKGTVIGKRSKRQMTYNPQGAIEATKVSRKRERDCGYLANAHSTTEAGIEYAGLNKCPRTVLYYPKDDTTSHSFAKPIALLEYLIRTFSNPGDVVFDPTMGSGSAGVAALNTGRKFFGAENGTDRKGRCIFDIAKAKIAAGVRGSTPAVDHDAQAVALDQYYTKPELAKRCVEIVERECGLEGRQVVEPSAGTGSFLRFLPPDTIAVDLDPKAKGITKQEFLAFDVESERDIITIGNPPFGKNSLLAVAFFNHAAKMSKTVAFIVPRTFRKASVVNRLHRNFHLVFEEPCPPDSFIFCGKPYDVPCVFQIWERRDEERAAVALPTRHADFEFAPKEQADFAVQRVGMGAGSIKTKFKRCAQSSHYFVRARVPTVFDRMGLIDFDSVRHDTAGNPSVSKRELIALYEATRGGRGGQPNPPGG
ncbi:DNA methyltransferase [Sphingomonas sp. NFX23]|uniref:DNA methyltransferase n=1 Tax=Sphingomonas sp. NFX23 TaxID=2819532 RepID=UPI003CEAD793